MLEELKNLVNLVELILENNNFTEVPDLTSLVHLERFDISNNYIKRVPLFTNRRLKEMDLSRNYIAIV